MHMWPVESAFLHTVHVCVCVPDECDDKSLAAEVWGAEEVEDAIRLFWRVVFLPRHVFFNLKLPLWEEQEKILFI